MKRLFWVLFCVSTSMFAADYEDYDSDDRCPPDVIIKMAEIGGYQELKKLYVAFYGAREGSDECIDLLSCPSYGHIKLLGLAAVTTDDEKKAIIAKILSIIFIKEQHTHAATTTNQYASSSWR